MDDLLEWLERHSAPEFIWYVKRLSGNDTLANGSNQAGPYLPKGFLFKIFPRLDRKEIKNPDLNFDLHLDSHGDVRTVRAIWYNNQLHDNPKGGRNETRITGLGGRGSPLLSPDSTGALVVFAFPMAASEDRLASHVWVCRNRTEEEVVEDRVGPVEPGRGFAWPPPQQGQFDFRERERASCWLAESEIPAAWLLKFPTGADIIRKAIELRHDRALAPDQRLLRRRECEFEIFRSVEQAIELPKVSAGFPDIDSFIARAQTILQRRKARSGHSLELHAKEIFVEENLIEHTHFSHQPESEPGKKPDFLFPSVAAYRDASFASENLRMLAVKTTCRDRWRQILNEADRVPRKHLLTLQEGVSESQFREMQQSGVQLVVPTGLITKFAKPIRPHLQTLANFIEDVKTIAPRES